MYGIERAKQESSKKELYKVESHIRIKMLGMSICYGRGFCLPVLRIRHTV
jgi:hypothetical protein